MRDVMMAGAALAAVALLAACGAAVDDPAQLPTPSGSAASAVAPTSLPPLETSPAPEETAAEPEPSLELAPTATLSPVAKPTPQGGPWTAVTAAMSSRADVEAAAGLPASFQEFLGVRIGYADETGCVTTHVSVSAVHPDGFVVGDESTTCGDSRTVWGITEGRWHYIVAFQDAMPCRDLTQNDIPPGVPGLRCLDDVGAARDY
ncbi:hypothetical protein [Tessaracoccus lapidicaptus]|uniref:hypothetical protein n=1 Tax=Tessaracoccus lapidicaptus TaxID=1427523 RepID=UPI003342919A